MISSSMVYTVIITIGLALFSGCATNTNTQGGHYSSDNYLQLASSTEGYQKQAYLLKATSQLIEEHQIKKAQFVFNQVKSNLPESLKIKRKLTRAKFLIARNHSHQALNILKKMPGYRSWPQKDRIEWHAIAAKAEEKLGNLSASVQQRSDIISLLSKNNDKKRYLLAIWQSLEDTQTSRILSLLPQATTPTTRGWLSLAAITATINAPPRKLTESLQRWKEAFPNHPAIALLPTSLKKLHNIPTNHPQHIALLVPLKGHYGKAGIAIRNGFLAAYYNNKKKGNSKTHITIIDTSNKNIRAAYQEALQEKADFVVGPLIKNNIKSLVESTPLPVPTLALNTLPQEHLTLIKNLYQFALSPTDEAKQAAIKAWRTHKNSAIIITPKNGWGQAIAAAFEKTWLSLGGHIVTQLAYTNQRNLSIGIRHLLNIDQANQNEIQLKRILHENLRYIPRRRKDADMIFMVANPKLARQICPLLRYYYAGNIPIYATSQVYSGHHNRARDHDLNGIHFPDMPWVLKAQLMPSPLNAIRDHIKQTWPRTYAKEPKLFALGVDAYDMIIKLDKMVMLPDLGTSAATGTLYLDRYHRIYRKLIWSKMSNGIPVTNHF